MVRARLMLPEPGTVVNACVCWVRSGFAGSVSRRYHVGIASVRGSVWWWLADVEGSGVKGG